MSQDYFRQHLSESISVKQALLSDDRAMACLLDMGQGCLATIKAGHKILIAGNGGSAADAQHFAAELVSRFYFDRPALPAIALTTDSSILTAIGNDYGFENLFKRQIQALGQRGDLFIGISTSGSSPNILHALSEAKTLGLTCYGLTGSKEGEMAELCDLLLRVPSPSTPRIQEGHALIGHMLCAYIEDRLFKKA